VDEFRSRRGSRHGPQDRLAVVQGANQEFAQFVTRRCPRRAGELRIGVRTQQEVRMSAMLDDIMRRDNDRDVHCDRVVDSGAQIDVLAEDDDGFNAGPPVGDLVDVACDPDAAGAVDHLLLYDAAGLTVQFA